MSTTKKDIKGSAAQAALAARIEEKNRATSGHHGPEKRALFSRGEKKSNFPAKELIKLSRGLGAMLRANINTADAIKYYSSRHPNMTVRNTLKTVREQIEGGLPAYAAFEKTEKFVD